MPMAKTSRGLGEGLRARVSLQTATTGFIALVCLILFAVYALDTWTARLATIAQAKENTANLARSIAQHAEDAIRMTDGALVGLIERLEVDGTDVRALARLH